MTACFSGAAKLAWRQRGEKNAVRASTVENWSTELRGPSVTEAWWLFLVTSIFFFLKILTSTNYFTSNLSFIMPFSYI